MTDFGLILSCQSQYSCFFFAIFLSELWNHLIFDEQYLLQSADFTIELFCFLFHFMILLWIFRWMLILYFFHRSRICSFYIFYLLIFFGYLFPCFVFPFYFSIHKLAGQSLIIFFCSFCINFSSFLCFLQS